MTKEEVFYIGYITKTKGLKGEVQLFFEFEDYRNLDLEVLFIELNAKMVPFFTSSHKLYENKTGLFYFDDIDHVDKARELVKKKVFLPLSKKPERNEDEFYFTDLKGYLAIDEIQGKLGIISEVTEFPQQFVAFINYQGKEILFPLNEDFIVEIDEEKKELFLNLPKGLLDVYLN